MKPSKSRCGGRGEELRGGGGGGGALCITWVFPAPQSPPCQPHPSAFNRQPKVYTGHCNNSRCLIRSENLGLFLSFPF